MHPKQPTACMACSFIVTQCFDVLVIGAGPAGLAIAAACADQGLNVACLSLHGVQPWHNTYGVWYDELPAELLPTIGHSWQKVYVRTQRISPDIQHIPEDIGGDIGGDIGMRGAQLLGRQYAFFDNDMLQKHLLERCYHVTWLTGFVSQVEHEATASTVYCRPDAHNATLERHQARLVIDASGHRSPLIARPADQLAFQVAYGVVGTFSRPPIAPNSMMLMDFDDGYLHPEERQQATFLYAADMGNGQYFVEETALAVRPALPFGFFKDRLERRLAARGCTLLSSSSQEHCLFPMNPRIPPAQATLAYGAAASMVHPASGYMVGLALRYAPELAATIATSLQSQQQQNIPSGKLAMTAWQHLWSADTRYRQQLYRFGLEALLSMDSPHTQAFFQAFFAIPERDWRGYLSNRLTTVGILRAMTQVFVRAPWRVRGKLVAAALKHPNMLLPTATPSKAQPLTTASPPSANH